MARKVIVIVGEYASETSSLGVLLKKYHGEESCTILQCKDYRKDKRDLRTEEYRTYSHYPPTSVDIDLLASHIRLLTSGLVIDWSPGGVADALLQITPSPLIIVEGASMIVLQELPTLYNASVYVETPEPVRYRRYLRAVEQSSGDLVPQAAQAWQETIQPFYHQFVEPCKKIADVTVDALTLSADHIPVIWGAIAGALEEDTRELTE